MTDLSQPRLSPPLQTAARSVETISHWQRVRRRLATRRALLEMSDEQLRDIGLSREQAVREATRPWWQMLLP